MTDANKSWNLLCKDLGDLVKSKPLEACSLDVRMKWASEIQEKMVSGGALFQLLCDRYIQHIGHVSNHQS
jgi:hypothetical protein